MAEIKDEIVAYERLKEGLEAKSLGKWVLMRDLQLIDIYDSFEFAAEDAVRRFGAGPYLIRQVGAPPVTLPVSVSNYRQHANDKMRV